MDQRGLESRFAGLSSGSLHISSNTGQDVSVSVESFAPSTPPPHELEGFIESDGHISIEAVHYTKKIDRASVRWEIIDDIGRTLSSMSVFPVTAESVLPGPLSPCLEYKMYLFHAGNIGVEAIFDPTLNFVPGRGLRYVISFDEESPQVIDVLAHNNTEAWATSVEDSVRKATSKHKIADPGYHTLKIWMVDPGVVLQKLVVDLGGVRPNYLGPPESFYGIGPKSSAQ